MRRLKRPGHFAPLPTGYFPHPKTHLVAQIHPLAPYAFLYLVALEAEQRLGGNESGEVKTTHANFSNNGLLGTATGANRASGDYPPGVSLGLNKKLLAAYQTVGWVELKGFDEVGFHALMRNSAEWHGQDANRPKKRREESTNDESLIEESFSVEVAEVFEHWKQATGTAKARLGSQIAKHIRARLHEGLTVSDLCQAVDGCVNEPWHKVKRKWELTYIFRNNENATKFMGLAPKNRSGDFDSEAGIV